MGKITPEEKERNKQLYEDYKSGKFSLVGLVTKYQITPTRIYQIIAREKKREKQS
jgi:Mor family transcriptional regulator